MKIIEKLKLSLIFSIIPLFLGCKPNTTIATINLQVIDNRADSASYYVSRNGFWAYSLWGWNTIQLDSTGSFVITIDDDDGNIILVTPSSENFVDQVLLYVRPGENYDVILDKDPTKRITINGKYADGQKLYTEYYNKRPPSHRYPLLYEFYSDTIPQNMLVKMEDLLKKDLRLFNEALETRTIDEEFYMIAKTQVEYYYMHELMSILARRNYAKERERLKYADNALIIPIDIKRPEYNSLLGQVFEKYPHNNPMAKLSLRYDIYLLYYLWYKGAGDDLINGPWDKKSKKIKCAEKFLDKELFEFYYAKQFESYGPDDRDGAMEKRFEDFKTRFPNSQYLPQVTETVKMWPSKLESIIPVKVDTTEND